MKTGITLQQQRDFYSSFYGDGYCYCNADDSLENIDQAICDCRMLLEYSIDQKNTEEIAFWRKMLQENKIKRREMLTA